MLANGQEAHWDYIHHDGAAAVLPVTSEGKILMVRQYRNALNRYTLAVSYTHLPPMARMQSTAGSKKAAA